MELILEFWKIKPKCKSLFYLHSCSLGSAVTCNMRQWPTEWTQRQRNSSLCKRCSPYWPSPGTPNNSDRSAQSPSVSMRTMALRQRTSSAERRLRWAFFSCSLLLCHIVSRSARNACLVTWGRARAFDKSPKREPKSRSSYSLLGPTATFLI